ncbi:TPA: hypothetical protein KKX58_001645 [Legionella pneumophila]|nr:hypothetical protein [Legionella pneumophila]HBD7410324.1 hypothetical protein [Legionella pneumophila]HBD9405517.1 hypothetical protein [Legionella pneumophila]HBI2968746.1 hypothetical protein [Legionella pneumophila]
MKKGVLYLAILASLCACQSQVPPTLPVFNFRQWEETPVNPASYHACGDLFFPCSNQPVVIIKKEIRRVTVNTVQK